MDPSIFTIYLVDRKTAVANPEIPSQIYWLVVFRPTPLKHDGVSNSWDDDIPNIQYVKS